MAMNIESINKIKIDMTVGKPILWNIDDVMYIKEKCRILGKEIGPLATVNNSNSFGLPLLLMNEEAKLLSEKGFAELVEYPVLKEDPSREIVEKNQELLLYLNNSTKLKWKESKIKIIKERATEIMQGKLKKQLKEENAGTKSVNESIIIAEEIKKIDSKAHGEVIKVYLEHPFLKELPFKFADWSFPDSNKDKLKYAIYKDLWENSYYVTCGVKFGGDYLVYCDNPELYHASYIVKCSEDKKPINPADLVLWARLGTATQKTLVMASIDANGIVRYLSFQFPGKSLDVLG